MTEKQTSTEADVVGFPCDHCKAMIDLSKHPYNAFERRFIAECSKCRARYEVIHGEHSQVNDKMPRGPRMIRGR